MPCGCHEWDLGLIGCDANRFSCWQYERLDDENRAALFEYFLSNPPSNTPPNGHAAVPYLLELPIFLNWAGSRAPAEGVLGMCPSVLVEYIACTPQELPASVQVSDAYSGSYT